MEIGRGLKSIFKMGILKVLLRLSTLTVRKGLNFAYFADSLSCLPVQIGLINSSININFILVNIVKNEFFNHAYVTEFFKKKRRNLRTSN